MFDDEFFAALALAIGPPGDPPCMSTIDLDVLYDAVLERLKQTEPETYYSLRLVRDRVDYVKYIFRQYQRWYKYQHGKAG